MSGSLTGMKKNSWPLWLLLLTPLLLSGCSTTTNLTAETQKRHPNGLYSFEVALDSNLRTIRSSTLQPYVIIGSQAYPMQPTPLVKDRWETLVPIPADKEFVNYRFKFNYEYESIPHPKRSSKLSPPYQIHILDR